MGFRFEGRTRLIFAVLASTRPRDAAYLGRAQSKAALSGEQRIILWPVPNPPGQGSITLLAVDLKFRSGIVVTGSCCLHRALLAIAHFGSDVKSSPALPIAIKTDMDTLLTDQTGDVAAFNGDPKYEIGAIH